MLICSRVSERLLSLLEVSAHQKLWLIHIKIDNAAAVLEASLILRHHRGIFEPIPADVGDLGECVVDIHRRAESTPLGADDLVLERRSNRRADCGDGGS